MKKSFMYIFFVIILICFLGNLGLKSDEIRKFFLLQSVPIIKIVNEECNGIKNISYMQTSMYRIVRTYDIRDHREKTK